MDERGRPRLASDLLILGSSCMQEMARIISKMWERKA